MRTIAPFFIALLLAGCSLTGRQNPGDYKPGDGSPWMPVTPPAPKNAISIQKATVKTALVANAVVPAGQPLTLLWDTSGPLLCRVYASSDKLTWTPVAESITNRADITTAIPKSFRAVPVYGEVEGEPSNTLTVLSNTPGIVVIGQHAATVKGPWTDYTPPVYDGPATNGAQVYRLKVNHKTNWATVSTP